MLRNFAKKKFFPLALRRSLSAQPAGTTLLNPSTKTSVLLDRFPLSINENSLRDALKDIPFKKVELEPGCSLHFLRQSEAQDAAATISENLNMPTCLRNASVPTLAMYNISETATADQLKSAFAPFHPVSVSLTGQHKAQAKMILRLPSSSSDSVIEAVKAAVSKVGSTAQNVTIDSTRQLRKPALFIRNVAHIKEEATLKKLLEDSDGQSKVENSSSSSGSGSGSSLSDSAEPERVQYLRRDRHAPVDMAVAYFSSERAALAAQARLQAAVVDGRRFSISYREVAEPGVLVSNLPASATAEEVMEIFAARFNVARVDMHGPASPSSSLSGTSPSGTATVVLDSPRDVMLACAALNRSELNGRPLELNAHDVHDIGIELSLGADGKAASISQQILAALTDSEIPFKSSTLATDVGAEVAFLTQHQAWKAQTALVSGAVELPSESSSGSSEAVLGTVCSSELIASPSFVVQVGGLTADGAASDVVAQLQQSRPELVDALLQVNRSALVKFRRHKEVVPGMKALKKVRFPADAVVGAAAGGGPTSAGAMRVTRYLPLVPEGSSEYDDLDYGSHPHQLAGRSGGGRGGKTADHYGYSDVVGIGAGASKSSNTDLSGSGSVSGNNGSAMNTRQRAAASVEFDRFALQSVLQDYMDTDPATRYSLAKNAFERALFDAKATNNINLILSDDLPAETRQEARALFERRSDMPGVFGGDFVRDLSDEEIRSRLFRIFLQKEEMKRLAADFGELEKLLGPADEQDVLNWSQFQIMAGSDLERILSALKKADEQAVSEMASAAIRAGVKVSGADVSSAGAGAGADADVYAESILAAADAEAQEYEDATAAAETRGAGGAESGGSATEIVIKSEGEEEQDIRISLSGAMQQRGRDTGDSSEASSSAMDVLSDKDGNLWSACVLDTDMVQKTMPGNRVNTFRALVVVGNCKGAAGFGMGKGKSGPDAVTAACRAALRNLTHIDLYDNSGLAHDVYGKHNSCNAYVRATPLSRAMVASPLATEVLTRFGIASASVKLVGRRNPYSQVRALFDALQKHENIDEYAKERGKSYLTLRWAHERGL